VAKLNAQKRVLVLELRQQKKGLMDQVHYVLLHYTISQHYYNAHYNYTE
jgi:hypothetical protein